MKEKISIDVGKFHYSYSHTSAPGNDLNVCHLHDVYEIIYVIEGEGKFVIEGREYPLRAHTFIVIPPFEYHYVDLSADSVYERCVLNFSESDVIPECRELLSAFKKNDSDQTCFYIASLNNYRLVSVFEQMEGALDIADANRPLYVKLLLSELLLMLSSLNADKVALEDAELGARVIRYLNENIENDITLDKLAKRFFVSKYYLCRAFKKHNGTSIHGYINEKRVMYAKQLIESGETASRAAYRVGFGDYSAFYRAYVKIVGKSPTA